MFSNLKYKILAALASSVFWIFLVSLESTFFVLPQEVEVAAFNMSPELAIAGDLPGVRLTLKTNDSIPIHSIAPDDFEAYIDLRNIGVGIQTVPVLVRSKNADVNVLRAVPSEIKINIEPMRSKSIALIIKAEGKPADGYMIDRTELSQKDISVSAAQSAVNGITLAQAVIILDGTEKQDTVKPVQVRFYSRDGEEVKDFLIQNDAQITAHVFIKKEPAASAPDEKTGEPIILPAETQL